MPPDAGVLCFALDGGGTQYRAALSDTSGNLLWHASIGGGALSRIGAEAATQRVVDLLQEGGRAAAGIGGVIGAAVVGLAGGRAESTQRYLREEVLGRLDDPPPSLRFTHDAALALSGALGPGSPGCVVVAGTGSVAIATDGTSRQVLAGGWGWPLGDAGSATWLGYRAVQQAAASMETGKPGEIASLVALEWELVHDESMSDLLQAAEGSRTEPHRYGRLAPLVMSAAENGHPEAAALAAETGIVLGALAARALDLLSMPLGGMLPVCLTGGLGGRWRDLLEVPFMDGIGGYADSMEYRAPILSPLGGGLLLALGSSGIGPGALPIESLRRTLSG